MFIAEDQILVSQGMSPQFKSMGTSLASNDKRCVNVDGQDVLVPKSISETTGKTPCINNYLSYHYNIR